MRTRFLAPAALIALTAGVVGHVRLETSGGNEFFWNDPDDVGILINSAGSDDIADDSETAAIRLAIEEWNAASGSNARLVEDTDAVARASTDWMSTATHIVMFDENDSSGYFPGSSGTVAVTPLLFQSNGRIVDADILFNGDDWQFTTTGESGRFDVQDVVAHELGHLLGLDHSGWAGSTMYPFVDPQVFLHRSISDDEVRGMRDAYPSASFGEISGTVERSADNSPVEGAHVVARNADGRTAAGTLSDGNGDFLLEGLDPGSYTVYAVPLDDPVSSSNLGDGSSFVVQTDFEPATFAGQVTITGTETASAGTLLVDGDVNLNLGESSDLFPVQIVRGTTNGPFFLSGTDLVNGSTLTISDTDLVLSNVIFFNGSLTFTVDVPAGEIPGHVDLTVTDPGGDVTILTSALEITAAAPTVTMVSPTTGSANGGTSVSITGTGFNAGARVVIGDQVYVDGVDATVNGSTSITLTTAATFADTHDVVVYDPSGVEGRLADGFRTGVIPAIQVLFPDAGSSAGSTQVTVTGTDFTTGLTVEINGVPQTVDSVTDTEVVFTTVAFAGALGVPQTVTIENPGGEMTTSSFTFETQADPVLAMIDPPQGKTSGGEMITLTGTGFTANTQVLFGVDPSTGTGGTAAPMVTFVDANTLNVMTPSVGKGTVAVLVRDATTGQSTVLPAAFTFQSSSSGGGCTMRRVDEPGPGPLSGAWWIVALLGMAALRGRRATPARERLQ